MFEDWLTVTVESTRCTFPRHGPLGSLWYESTPFSIWNQRFAQPVYFDDNHEWVSECFTNIIKCAVGQACYNKETVLPCILLRFFFNNQPESSAAGAVTFCPLSSKATK